MTTARLRINLSIAFCFAVGGLDKVLRHRLRPFTRIVSLCEITERAPAVDKSEEVSSI